VNKEVVGLLEALDLKETIGSGGRKFLEIKRRGETERKTELPAGPAGEVEKYCWERMISIGNRCDKVRKSEITHPTWGRRRGNMAKANLRTKEVIETEKATEKQRVHFRKLGSGLIAS